ncbi:unnamed protein product [Brassicogethes aeneus]|uniref:CUB domain-containing protein n=1 Tax=Brassicogethes aeneus TaxID=1431903 RepID=A0A9P0FDQ3_BRAAE|nr:unnamed protein product [Brassicogethes aeneus]
MILNVVVLLTVIKSGFCVLLEDIYDPFTLFWWSNGPYNVNTRCLIPSNNGDIVGECTTTAKCFLYGGTVSGGCGIGRSCCRYAQENKQCKVKTNHGIEVTGTCLGEGDCQRSGGASHGKCGGLFQKCCVYDNTCGKITTAKVSYFDGNYLQTQDQTTSCTYTIFLNNPNICQVRLDFETFHLAPPETSASLGTKCVTDTFNVEPSNYGIPTLCGTNDNQHVYVHLQPGDEKVTLNMKLSRRTLDNTLIGPHWRIKATQLQCSGDKKKDDSSQFDYPLLAPRGTIQYYTDTIGTIKSFGYGHSYTTGEHYSIAIKKDPGYCLAKFSFITVNMLQDEAGTGDKQCIDYLNVPDFFSKTLVDNAAKVCTQDDFYSLVPGPLSLTFSSASVAQANTENVEAEVYNFKLKYELQGTCDEAKL